MTAFFSLIQTSVSRHGSHFFNISQPLFLGDFRINLSRGNVLMTKDRANGFNRYFVGLQYSSRWSFVG